MNTTTLMKDFLQEVEYLANKDMDATSEEDFACCPGGKARPATNYIAEAGLFNTVVSEVVTNPENAIDMQSRYEVLKEITTKDQSREMFTKGCRDLEAAIESTSAEDLATEVTAPWGMPSTKGKLLMWGINHSMYHLGQLNQLQLIKGDEDVHWM
ncbi:MAG: DinB family protein [Fimbriimonadaceae bacterium]